MADLIIRKVAPQGSSPAKPAALLQLFQTSGALALEVYVPDGADGFAALPTQTLATGTYDVVVRNLNLFSCTLNAQLFTATTAEGLSDAKAATTGFDCRFNAVAVDGRGLDVRLSSSVQNAALVAGWRGQGQKLCGAGSADAVTGQSVDVGKSFYRNTEMFRLSDNSWLSAPFVNRPQFGVGVASGLKVDNPGYVAPVVDSVCSTGSAAELTLSGVAKVNGTTDTYDATVGQQGLSPFTWEVRTSGGQVVKSGTTTSQGIYVHRFSVGTLAPGNYVLWLTSSADATAVASKGFTHDAAQAGPVASVPVPVAGSKPATAAGSVVWSGAGAGGTAQVYRNGQAIGPRISEAGGNYTHAGELIEGETYTISQQYAGVTASAPGGAVSIAAPVAGARRLRVQQVEGAGSRTLDYGTSATTAAAVTNWQASPEFEVGSGTLPKFFVRDAADPSKVSPPFTVQ